MSPKEVLILARKRWIENNPERHKTRSARWRAKYPEKHREQQAKRRATKKGSTPKWTSEENEFFISEIYSLAQLRTKTTGVKWDVDHIVPLKGRSVCGLHVWNNLQVITEKENCKKGNRYVE